MDVICYGFNSFGQIAANGFQSLLTEHGVDSKDSFVKFVTFSWSKCFIILGNSVLIMIQTNI